MTKPSGHDAAYLPQPRERCPTCGGKRKKDTVWNWCCKDSFHNGAPQKSKEEKCTTSQVESQSPAQTETTGISPSSTKDRGVAQPDLEAIALKYFPASYQGTARQFCLAAMREALQLPSSSL